MKKIILLFVILFTITGCYDYQELNNRAIVSGISIDYEQDEYTINYEVLNSEGNSSSSGESSDTSKAFLVEGKGKTILEAFENASNKMSKATYLSHLKVLILSENAAKERTKEIVDYMLREPNIRNIFTMVIAKDCTAKELLDSSSKEAPVISEEINQLIQNNKYSENISIEIDFDKFMDYYQDNRIDPAITSIELINELPTLTGIAIFKSGNLKSILNEQEAAIFNLLTNNSSNHRLTLPCEGNKKECTIINLYNNHKTEIEIQDNKLKIKSKLEATVIKDTCGYDFRDASVYNELSEKFANILKEEYEQFWQKITEEESDILGIQKKYYQKNRTELPNWKDLQLETEIEIEINKNGLTFEVKDNE